MKPDRLTTLLGGLAALGLVVGLAAAFGYAPREAVQGNVQRIMYVHVPAVLTAYLAILVVLVGSVGYLVTRRPGWDHVAGAAGELGVLFTAITIASALTAELGQKAARPLAGGLRVDRAQAAVKVRLRPPAEGLPAMRELLSLSPPGRGQGEGATSRGG